MPSLVRFLTVLITLVAVGYGGLYALAVYFEPKQKEVRKSIPGVKIRNE